MWKYALLFLLIIIAVWSCDNSTEPDSDSIHLISLQIVDTTGNPVSGLRIGSMNYSPYIEAAAPAKPCPSTPISFTLPEASDVKLSILNYYRQTIKTLIDGPLGAGAHSVYWDGTDSAGNAIISGYYFYRLVAIDSANNQTTWEKASIFELGRSPENTLIDTTDSKGIFQTDDTLLFPCLLGNPPPIVITDGLGNIIDTVEGFYADSVTFTLSSDDSPGQFLFYNKRLIKGANSFELIWDPSLAE